MNETVPLLAVPSQTIEVALGNQQCTLKIAQKRTGVFMDVYKDDVAVVCGVLCLNNNVIVRDAYHGFAGDLLFFDTQGSDDPTYDGFGTRYVLLYVS